MKILLVSQYFFPETGATSNRLFSLAKKIQEEGHEVRIIAEKPNHPKGIFFPGFEKGGFINKEYKGIPVTYSWVYTRPEKGFIGRMLFYFSFMVSAIFAAYKTKGKYDIVCASSPPLFVGISGWLIAKIKGAKFVFDVRDLWPDVAVKMGALNNEKAIKAAENIERFIYSKADLITVVTKSFKKSIIGKGFSHDKIEIVTNGTEPEVFNIKDNKSELRGELNLKKDDYLVSYVGNLGLAQGLNHIIIAAQIIEQQNIEDVTFLFVGDGPQKSNLMELVARLGVKNVIFRDRVPLDTAAKYMNASDVLLVPLGDDPIYSQFIPSKLFDSMAASNPVLLSVDGESRWILDEAQAGLYYEAENAKQLSEKIMFLKKHPEKAKEMALNGSKFVEKNYTRDVQAAHMLTFLEKLTK